MKKYILILDDGRYYMCETDSVKSAMLCYLNDWLEELDDKMAFALSQCEDYTVKDLINYMHRNCCSYDIVQKIYIVSEEINLDK